ncbi:ATP-dependent DNA helicase RecG [Tomitella fengzijianii]|uniref:Probable DNA 3'-5' helicase RecG n=1 Tax=Tomitella fengzijianii TaxID=2597660 RepID=A0A516X403_9ACTN|nr:ATP-dependent DNA helicase RecG [Tomitella fengzijianii]QDQ97723.1 ATP-dependent DNA helicase RecG [Tomitella fengzijianii]
MATLTDRLDLLLGDATAGVLADQFELRTVGDLLRHYPRRYLRAGALMAPEDLASGTHVTIAARVVEAEVRPMRRNPRKKLLKAVLDDGRNRLGVTFFSPHKVRHHIVVGRRGLFSGQLGTFNGRLSLTHPDYLLLPETAQTGAGGGGALLAAGQRVQGGGSLARMAEALQDSGDGLSAADLDRAILPIYPASAKAQTWTIMRCVRQVLDQLEPVSDPLPQDIVARYGHMSLDAALRGIHRPSSEEEAEAARGRLRFDEAASMQLMLARRRADEQRAAAPASRLRPGAAVDAFTARLPFALTDGQQEVLAEVREDLQGAVPMRRLLQGEVGSGKTVIAVLAMLQAVDAGHQCAMLAPTEVLAVQHARSIRQLLGPLARAGELGGAEDGTRVTLLTGSMTTAERRRALLEITSGEAGIVVGTHALLEDAVTFFDLGLVVVDEQHRFGVHQRDRLHGKAREGLVPHLLVMTATPIPRTVALTQFGDLDTSTLRELPRGRSPIRTSVVSMPDNPRWVKRAWERIVEEVADGRQAYVVCARIGDQAAEPPAGSGPSSAPASQSDSAPQGAAGAGKGSQPDANAAVDVYDKLVRGALAGVHVDLLHGRMPSPDKDAVMRRFAAGEIDVLVSTTVVEVGVDVPNATVMVILDAERFGVSQLHQLRGRVGRGEAPGLCILISGRPAAAQSSARLESVAATTDGFELARLDLQLRHEGDVVGTAQSGRTSGLRLLSVLEDEDVILDAREFAADMVERDPGLTRHPGLAEMVSTVEGTERGEFLFRA